MAELYDLSLGIGRESKYEFSLINFLINGVDDQISHVVGLEKSVLEGRTVYYFLDALVRREQLSTVNNFFNQALDLLKDDPDSVKYININFGIQTLNGAFRKILFQLKRLLPLTDNKVLVRICDISHFYHDGPPGVFVLDGQGKVTHQQTGGNEVINDAAMLLTRRERDVLMLRGDGMRAKEIAKEMGISHMTVYSIIRDVKQKTRMELIPLIMQLRKMQSEK
jgi:DNA-binding CsgD family transcriptional regulator